MKKLFWLGIAILTIVACKKETSDYTVLSGKVENAKGLKEIRIRGSYDFSQVVEVKEDGSFADTLQPIKTGFYTLQFGRVNLPMYLEQEDNLNVTVDLSNRENPLSYGGGKTVSVNDYLVKNAYSAQEKIAKLGGFQRIFGMEESAFIETMTTIKQEDLENLEATLDLPEKFINLQKKTIDYNYLQSLSLYPEYHAYVTKDENYKPSELITKPLEELSYTNNDDYNEIGAYKQLVLSHFMREYQKEGAEKEAVVKAVKAAGIEFLPKDFAANLVQRLSLGEENIQAEADRIKSLSDDKDVMKKLEKFLETAAVLGQGKASPKFAYKSIKGKEVALDDLKGKLVYIDIWATWCGPCKGEIPYLQKLEKDYHNKPIHFVSISIDEDKEAWQQMVKEQKLGGIQLFAEGAWKSNLAQAYQVQGIPRFILLDKQGNIISADAPRPSTDKIRTLIDKWLKTE